MERGCMMGRSAWPLILIMALLLSRLEVAGAAQPPDSPPRQPAAPTTIAPPPDRRVRLAGSTGIIEGAVQPAPSSTPAAGPTSGTPATASPSPPGRTLIARSVDLNQPIPSLPPGANSLVSLKAAPMEPADHRFPINLATALRLSDA